MLAGGVFCGLALLTYDPTDPTPIVTSGEAYRNMGGPAGAWLADTLLGAIGIVSLLIAPMLFFFGEGDDAIPTDEVERVRDSLESQGKDVEVVTYPGAGSGFFCEARPDAYDEKAAGDAWTRTVDFIYQWLEG